MLCWHLFFRWGNWGSAGTNHLPKVTQPGGTGSFVGDWRSMPSPGSFEKVCTVMTGNQAKRSGQYHGHENVPFRLLPAGRAWLPPTHTHTHTHTPWYWTRLSDRFPKIRVKEGKNSNFTVESLGKRYPGQVVKSNITSDVIWICETPWCEVMCRALHFCHILSQNPQPRSNNDKNRQTQIGWHSVGTWPMLLKTIKVMKNKEKWRNYHRKEMGRHNS